MGDRLGTQGAVGILFLLAVSASCVLRSRLGVVQLFHHSLSVEALTREAAMIQALGITHILFKSRGSNNVLEVGSKSL